MRKLARSFEAVAVAASAIAMLGASACDPPAPKTFEVVIKVESDPGMVLPGAAVVRNGKDVALTDAQGRARLVLDGNEGDAMDFMVRCPADFISPTKPINVVLRKLGEGRLPEYYASCPPSIRKIIVAVRADNGPNLPVTYLGKPVARTDSAGAAHVLLAMKPGDQFELGLDTSGDQPGGVHLKPENPTKDFVVRPADEIQAFDIRFEREPPKPKYVKPKARPHRVGSTSTEGYDFGTPP